MNQRFLYGLVIVVTCLLLLLLVGQWTAGAVGFFLRFAPIALVLALYFAALRVRDKRFPKQDQRDSESGDENSGRPGRRARSELANPWTLFGISFVAIGASLAIVSRGQAMFAGTDAARLAYKIGYLGVVIPTVALLAARVPRRASDFLAEWWIPSGLLLLLSVMSAILLPGVVLLVRASTAEPPAMGAILILPFAVFIWRAAAVLWTDRTHKV